jgi:class 3 adenylate cyclase/rhodanese-related sulfurtransferase
MSATPFPLKRLQPIELKAKIDSGQPMLLLDVRRREAFQRLPLGISNAVPIALDEPAAMLPDIERDAPIVIYCLCNGMASSTRVALWLAAAGYQDVSLLDGGLPAWQAHDLPLAPLDELDRGRIKHWMSATPLRSIGSHQLIAEAALVAGQTLPLRRDLAVLFVDMVDSTRLLMTLSPESMLGLVQIFMETVVEIAVQHCGDVHDFQGDGAMLYFAGPGEALPATFRIREALAARRVEIPGLPQARFALDYGPLLIGSIGTADRRTLSFIGASINTAARILPLAPPGGIVATRPVIETARSTDPDLAAKFEPLLERHMPKGFRHPVEVFVARP